MAPNVYTPGDWRSRLAVLELEINCCETAGHINWHHRIHARILRFLLSRYDEPPPQPTHPLTLTDFPEPLHTLTPTGPSDWEDGDAGAIARAAAGVDATETPAPKLTWWAVCYGLLPWNQVCPPPGSEAFERGPRPPEVFADALRVIQAANTKSRQKRRWFRPNK